MLISDDTLDTAAEIDGVHHRLYRAIDRLEPIITNGVNEDAVMRAIHLLYARMERHFTVEEDLAEVNAPAACPALKADHGKLLAILWQMSIVPVDDGATRTRMLRQFEAALTRHDRDLDGPLFSATFH